MEKVIQEALRDWHGQDNRTKQRGMLGQMAQERKREGER